MKTFGELKTIIRTYLDESNQADFLDTEVATAANFAYHDVIGKVIEVYEDFYNTTTPFTYALVDGTQEYLIDPSLIKVTRVEANFKPTDSNSVAIRLIPVSMDDIRRNLANNTNAGSFFNGAYFLHGNIGTQKLGVLPVPTISDTTGKSLSVWGVALPSDLSATGDNVNIPYADRFAYLVALKASGQLLRKGQQDESSALRYIADYRAGVLEMQTFLKERKADDAWVITDSISDNIDFSNVVNI